MTLSALDISKKKIGIIIYDVNKEIILLNNVIEKNFKNSLIKIYKKYLPDKTIVGLSTHKDNNLTFNGKYTKLFCHSMKHVIAPFIFIDEYLSTLEASIFKKQNEMIDAAAARIILERYIKKPII